MGLEPMTVRLESAALPAELRRPCSRAYRLRRCGRRAYAVMGSSRIGGSYTRRCQAQAPQSVRLQSACGTSGFAGDGCCPTLAEPRVSQSKKLYRTWVLTIGACDNEPSLLRLFVALPSLRLSCSLASWYVASMAAPLRPHRQTR